MPIFQKSLPSAQLYLAWSMRDALAQGRIERLSQTVYRHASTLIVIRHLSGRRALPRHDRLIYVIDDDWRAGIGDRSLPASYRIKLALREALAAHRIEARADVILAASDVLAARYRARFPDKSIAVLEPAWPKAASLLARERPIHLACLSAATHRRDFSFLQPVLSDLLTRRGVRLTVRANAPVPRAWRHHERVDVVPAMDWTGYAAWRVGKSFDIGLYPTCRAPFNAARSRNKLLEFDQFGAALLCSDSWGPGRRAATEERCLALPDRQGDWARTLTMLIDRPGYATSFAKRNREALLGEDPLSRQRRIWEAVLTRDNSSPYSTQTRAKS